MGDLIKRDRADFPPKGGFTIMEEDTVSMLDNWGRESTQPAPGHSHRIGMLGFHEGDRCLSECANIAKLNPTKTIVAYGVDGKEVFRHNGESAKA